MITNNLIIIHVYYQLFILKKARFDHINPVSDEIEVIKGDQLHLYGNNWKGYFTIKNTRTGKQGLVPSFKISRNF